MEGRGWCEAATSIIRLFAIKFRSDANRSLGMHFTAASEALVGKKLSWHGRSFRNNQEVTKYTGIRNLELRNNLVLLEMVKYYADITGI